ncbi:MAG: CHAT domain-containing protein, partial [Bacteroidota bacterium]
RRVLELLEDVPLNWSPIQRIKAQQLRAYAFADLKEFQSCMQELESAYQAAQKEDLSALALELMRDQAKYLWKGEFGYTEAIDFLEAELKEQWVQDLEPNSDLARSYIYLGFLYRRVQKHAQEAYWYERAIPLFAEEERSTPSFFFACYYASTACLRLVDYERALNYLELVEPYAQVRKDYERLYYGFAEAYFYQEDFSAALNNTKRGLAIPEVSEHKRRQFLTLQMRILGEQKKYNQALGIIEMLEQEEDFGENLENWAEANWIRGHLALAKGQQQSSFALWDQAIARLDQEESGGRFRAKFKLRVAEVYLERRQLEKAIQIAQSGLSDLLPDYQPTSPFVLPHEEQLFTESWLVDAFRLLGKAHLDEYQNSGNQQHLKTAVQGYDLFWNSVEKLRNFYLTDGAKEYLGTWIYDWIEEAILANSLLYEESGQPSCLNQIFTLMQGSRAVTLADAYHRNQAFDQLGVNPQLLAKERLYRRSLLLAEDELLLAAGTEEKAEIQKEISDYRSRYDLWLSLLETFPALDRFLDNQSSLELKDYQGQLDAKEASLFFYWGEERVLLLAVRGQQARFYDLGKTSVIEPLLSDWMSYLAMPQMLANDLESWQEMGNQIRGILFPDNLSEMAQWNIFPDGPMYALPFEALRMGNQYLIEQQEIRMREVLVRPETTWGDTVQQYLGFAPLFEAGQRGLLPLSSSTEEMQALQERFRSSQAFLAETATRVQLKGESAKARLVHLSTHAQANAALGQPGIELFDAPLSLAAIYGLRLNSPLVFLSACESSLGNYQKGEGVMSLTRGFNYAGARAVIATLWSVNERSTAELVKYFYQNIGKKTRSAEALRQAKLAYLDDPEVPEYLKTPYYWAGIVHWGEPMHLASKKSWNLEYWPWVALIFSLAWCAWVLFGRKPEV